MKKSILLLSVIFFSTISFAQGQVINVPTDQPTIQEAINSASDGDTVLVADGTYLENINFSGKKITVASWFLIDGDKNHIDSTIIDGSQPAHQDSGSVVQFSSGSDSNSVLYGFTITGGSGSIDPYGIGSYGGGGIGAGSGCKIQSNKISSNSITHSYAVGGGIVVSGNVSQVLILDNEITNNTLIETGGDSKGGGGIFCYQARGDLILIANNLMSGNSVKRTNNAFTGYGGGIYLEKSVVEIRNNLIVNNKAKYGGGIGLENNPLSERPIIVNNTIVNNEASAIGGIYNYGQKHKIINSIIWGNIDQNGKQISDNLLAEYCDIEGIMNTPRIINLDPQFADTINYYLAETSPCIDAGFPLTMYYDKEDALNTGFPLFPALGKMRNDMGYCGGNSNMTKTEFPEFITPLKVDMDNDGVPDRKGESITATGVVSSINFQKSSGNLGFYIYDLDAGIYVFAEDDTTNFELGDWVEVHGTIDQYAGLTQITVEKTNENIFMLEHNHAVISATFYIDELMKNPEKYEGMFVRVNALKRNSGNWPTTNTIANIDVTDGYKTLTLNLDDDTDLGNNPEPIYPMDIKGIFSQDINSQHSDNGYHLLLNSYSDIKQNVEAAPSPYFFFKPETKELENGDFGAADYNDFTVYMHWYPAVDLNNDALTYEVLVIRNIDGIIVENNPSNNGGTSTYLSRTNKQIIDFIQEFGEFNTNDNVWTFNGNWILQVTDGNTGMITSIDTLKNFTLNDLYTDPTDVEDENLLPKEFELGQNYPNPFNPTTTISYSIPLVDFGFVPTTNLAIYDILGQEVELLIDKKQNPGSYQVTWDAKNFASGVYFCKLQVGSFIKTRKMILLR